MGDPDPLLPAALEDRLWQALDLPEPQRSQAIDGIRAEHPQHAPGIDRFVRELGRQPASGVEPPPAVPDRIGPYHLLRELGTGGFGVVYLAERREPVQQQVALKLIKLGMDSQAIVRRFQQERQALARMSHEAIARVFDCGTTERGQPYFVMEYIPGIPLTTYCDEHRLSLRERLALFRLVCAGVQHAHQKGVMHRDLKPSNILVAVQDGRPMPKIIDFGLARALDRDRVDTHAPTQPGQVAGTPQYMSPEQAGVGQLDVDTRTDVWSLGVILYELLTGELPIPRARWQEAGLLGIQRILEQSEPLKPSTRVLSLDDRAQLARARGVEPQELERRLRGDLDWIVMRALEKDRTRRYETPLELAAELERHLNHVPVLAGPPSATYRVRKFVRRYRAQCVAAGLVLASLLAAMVTTTWMYWQAEAARQAASSAETKASRRFDEVRSLARMVTLDATRGLRALPGSSRTVRFLVDQGLSYLERLAGEAGGDPSLVVEIARGYVTLGEVLGDPRFQLNFGETSRCRENYDKALALLKRELESHPGSAVLRQPLAEVQVRAGIFLLTTGDRARGTRLLDGGIAGLTALIKGSEAGRAGLMELVRAHMYRGSEAAQQFQRDAAREQGRLARAYLARIDARDKPAQDLDLLELEIEITPSWMWDEDASKARSSLVDLGQRIDAVAQREPWNMRARLLSGKVLGHQVAIATGVGDHATALALSQRWLQAAQATRDASPEDAQARREWRNAATWFAHALRKAGRSSQANDQLEEVLQNLRETLRVEPTDRLAQRDLCKVLGQLGEVHTTALVFARALPVWDEVLALGHELLAGDPDDLALRREVADAHGYRGLCLGATRPDAAVAEIRKAEAMAQEIMALPGMERASLEWRVSLAILRRQAIRPLVARKQLPAAQRRELARDTRDILAPVLALARAEWSKPAQRPDQKMLDLIANTVAEMDRALVALESQAASRPDR